MFGVGGRKRVKDQAVNAITENLRSQLTVYLNAGVLITAIQDDPYVAGYIQGKILSFIAYFVRAEGLAQEDANVVSGLVLLNVFGRDPAVAVSQAIKQHIAGRSPQYQEGQRKGVAVVAYAVGAQDVTRDPEYSKAVALFRSIEHSLEGTSDSDNHGVAIAGLEQLWLAQRLERL